MSRRRRKPSRSRAEAKQATRAALVEAGIEEIARHGLDVGVETICERAGLTRGAFYFHFPDRDAFLAAVMQHVLGAWVGALTTHAAGIAGAIDVFFAAARGRSPLVRGAAGLRFHHVLDACRRSKPIGDAYRSVVMLGRDQLRTNLAREPRAALSPANLADLLVVVALGVTTMYELDLPLDLDRLDASVRRLVNGD